MTDNTLPDYIQAARMIHMNENRKPEPKPKKTKPTPPPPIPIPIDDEIYEVPPGRGGGRPSKYHFPFLEMKVGQSFTISRDLEGHVQIIASALARFDGAGRKYQTRRISNNRARCFRVK